MSTIPTKEELTNQQLGPVLAVIRELQPYLLDDITEPGGTPTANQLNGEACTAAHQTFIKACARINFILDDTARWDLKAHNDAMAEFVKTHKAQQKFIASQTLSSEMLRKPHYMLRPTVATIGDDQYVAFWGDLSKPNYAICGVGPTPNAALADFDKAFDRAPREQVVIIAEQAGFDITKIDPSKSEQ